MDVAPEPFSPIVARKRAKLCNQNLRLFAAYETRGADRINEQMQLGLGEEWL